MNWYPDATVQAAPAWKQRGNKNPAEAAVLHSAEGWAGGLLHELQRADRGAAWHFSVLQSGEVWQHYPLNAVLWHAGNTYANARYIGIEHEGIAGQPLTDAQRAASVALVTWIASQRHWEPLRGVTLFEHNEVSDKGTECPSGRIPWEAYMVQVPQPVPTMLRWLYGVVPGMLDRTRWVRTESPSAGYRDDIYEVVVRRKIK